MQARSRIAPDIHLNLSPKIQPVSFRCLCCRDAAVIPADILNKYDLIPGYEYQPDVPVFCSRPSCRANKITVEAGDGGNRYEKESVRFDPDHLDTRITGSECEQIHQWELQELKSADPDRAERIAEAQRVFSSPEGVTGLIKSMNSPKVEKPTPAPVVVAEPLEVTQEMQAGFDLGDWVICSVDHLDKYSQREVVKHKEAPVGESGVILDFKINQVSIRLGKPDADAIVRLESGVIVPLPPDFLRKVSQ